MYVRLVGFYKAKCVKHLIIRILIGKHQSAALGPRHRLQLYTRWLKTDRWTDTHTRASANVASNKLRRASNVAKQHDSKRSLSNEQREWMRYGLVWGWEPKGTAFDAMPARMTTVGNDDNVPWSWRGSVVAARHSLLDAAAAQSLTV